MGYIGMCRCEGYGFQAVYSRIGYINQSVWVQNRVSFFYETDQLVEDFIQTRETATLGQGGFGEFTLVQGSKIQLKQLWYRLRVPGSQWHIPTQKFLKYPPGVWNDFERPTMSFKQVSKTYRPRNSFFDLLMMFSVPISYLLLRMCSYTKRSFHFAGKTGQQLGFL